MPVSDFSGLVSTVCALARAAARAAIDSLDRCIFGLLLQHFEADRPGLGALGPHPMAEGLLGVLGHQPLEPGLGLFVLDKSRSRREEYRRELSPRIRHPHID